MRVIHVITRLIVGGAQENTIATVLGLKPKPDVSIKLLSGPTIGPEGSLVSEFHSHRESLELVSHLVRPIHPWKDVLAWRQLLAAFRREKPDIVHTHSGKAGFLGRLAAARAGVPVIIHTIHGPSFGNFQGASANRIFLEAERRAGKVTTQFISVADAMTRQYLAAGIGVPTQYTTVYSGFPLEPFLLSRNDPQLRAQWGISPGDLVVGKVSRLFKLKGHEDLFRAAPELLRENPRLKFLLVGDGPLLGQFRGLAEKTGLRDRFIFTGLAAPREIPGLIGIMDVVVHLSRREGLARVLPQALAAAKPVIACDCDGAGEVCFQNETGFLVQPGDIATLSARIRELAQNTGLREQFGARGRQFVRERFGVERMVDSLYALYLRLASGDRART